MKERVEGIVLQYVKYGENGIIGQLYTQEYGRLACLFKSIRTKKSAAKAVCIQPLFLVDIGLHFHPQKNMHTVYDIKMAHPYIELPFDVVKSSLSFFLAELLHKTLKETEQNAELFRFLKYAFLLLDHSSEKVSNFHLVFLLQLSSFLGFAPRNNYSPQHPFFDLLEGQFVSSSSAYSLGVEESQLLQKALSCPLKESHTLIMNSKLREELLNQLLQFYRFHVENIGTFKSLQVLRELFQ